MRCSLAKIHHGWFASLFILVVLTLSGCLLSDDAPTRYFLIDYVGDGGARDQDQDQRETPFDAAVIVEDPTVGPLYDRRQIVQRPEAPEILLRTRDLWVVSPGDAVREVVYDRLREEDLFPEVGRRIRGVPDPYVLRTHIDTLEYRCCAETPLAIFDIELMLLDAEENVVARHRSATEDEIPASVTEFVLTVNRRLSEAIDQLVAEIRTAAP